MFRGFFILVAFLFAMNGYSQTASADTQQLAGIEAEDTSDIISEFSHAVTEKGRVVISWKIRSRVPEFFAIERSDNGKNYDIMSVLNLLQPQPFYQWTDDAPKKGKTYYRIRYSLQPGQTSFSKPISCLIEGFDALKFYPNPVDQILIVRSEFPVDVMITDATGKARITQPKVSGLQTINVSSLEKGIYLIRFTNKLSNAVSQEKLVKN